MWCMRGLVGMDGEDREDEGCRCFSVSTVSQRETMKSPAIMFLVFFSHIPLLQPSAAPCRCFLPWGIGTAVVDSLRGWPE